MCEWLFGKKMGTLVAEFAVERIDMPALWAHSLCSQWLGAFSAELHAFRVLNMTVRALYNEHHHPGLVHSAYDWSVRVSRRGVFMKTIDKSEPISAPEDQAWNHPAT